MTLDDFVGFELHCRMSLGLKNESGYTDEEFFVIMSKDKKSESGYTAKVSGKIGEAFQNDWDGEVVGRNILFGDWEILSKKKI